MRAVSLVILAACAAPRPRAPTLEPCLEAGKMYQSLRSLAYHVAHDDGLRAALVPLARALDLAPLREALDPAMAEVIEARLDAAPAPAHAIWFFNWYYDDDGSAHEQLASLAREHLASDDPPGWELELPCAVTIDLPTGDAPASVTGDFHARYRGGPWRPFQGTATWDAKTHQVELDAEGLRWRWRDRGAR